MKPPHSRGPGQGPRPHGGPSQGFRRDRPPGSPGGGADGGKPGGPRPQHGQKPRPAARPPGPGRAAPAQPDRRPDARPDLRPDPRPDPRPDHRAGPPAAPRSTVWLYGLHAVGAALANPARRLRRLVLTEEAEAKLATRFGAAWPLPPERMERARLDQLLGHDVAHQGVAVLADPLAPPLLATALERPGPLIVLDQVTDPRNVGAILRSAAAFGAAALVTQDRNAPDETGALAKAASGALEIVPLLRAVNIARTIVALKAAGLWCVGLDASAPAPLAGPALAERRVALILGAEGEGLRRLTRETCDETAKLLMPGDMESLNVSAAAAVALYELGRR